MSSQSLSKFCNKLHVPKAGLLLSVKAVLDVYTCKGLLDIIPGVMYSTSDSDIFVFPFQYLDGTIGLRCVENSTSSTMYINVVGNKLVLVGYEPNANYECSSFGIIAARLSTCRRLFDGARLTQLEPLTISDKLKNATAQDVKNLPVKDQLTYGVWKIHMVVHEYENV